MSALQDEIRLAVQPLANQIAALTEEVATLRKVTPVELVDVTQAAKILGCKPETVRRKVRDGSLKCKRVGTKMRFNPCELIK
jgi:excisionase family DNA binding protein